MKQIPLTKNQFAWVDDEDYLPLTLHKWLANYKPSDGTYHAMRYERTKKGKSRGVYMARQILGLKHGDPRIADHKNHDTLDNTRNNLRICTKAQNSRNHLKLGTHCKRKFSSRYTGVSKSPNGKEWRARIGSGPDSHLGYYATEWEAAKAYNDEAWRRYRDFAHPNIFFEPMGKK